MNFLFILNLVLIYVPLFSEKELGKDFFGIDFPIFFGLGLNAVLGTILSIYLLSVDLKNKLNLFFAYFIFFLGVTGSYLAGKTIWLILFWEISSLGVFYIHSQNSLKQQNIKSLLAYIFGSSLSMLFLTVWIFLPESNLTYSFFILATILKSGFSFLHIWYPESYKGASSHLSASFSGISLNVPFLLFLRYASNWFSQIPNLNYLLILAGVGVFLGGLSSFFSKDLKKSFSFSTIEYSNLIWFFLFSFSIWKFSSDQEVLNISKSVLILVYILIFTHSFSKSFQFLVFGKVEEIANTSDLDSLKGVGKLLPYSNLILGIGTFSFAAIPGTIGFISESTVLFLISKIIDLKLVDSLLFLLGIIFLILGIIFGVSTHLKAYFTIFLSSPRKKYEFSTSHFFKFSINLLGFIIFVFPNILFLFLFIAIQFKSSLFFKNQFFSILFSFLESVPFLLQTWFINLMIVSILFTLIYILVYFFKFRHKISTKQTWDCGNEYSGEELSIPASTFSDPIYYSIGRYFVSKNGEPIIDSSVKNFLYSILNLGKYWIDKVESGEISYYILFSVLSFILSLVIIVSLKVYL